MQSRYICVFKLEGISSLPDGQDRIIASFTNPNIEFLLTSAIEEHCVPIDLRVALSNVSINSVFGKPSGLSAEERISLEIEKVRRTRQQECGTGVFLVCRGDGTVEAPNLSECRDRGDYIFCLDATEPGTIRNMFMPSIHALVAALNVCLFGVGSGRFRSIGEVGFLIEERTGKPLYSFTLQAKAFAYVSAPLDLGKLLPLSSYASQFGSDKTLGTIARLLNQSLSSATDQLRAFMTAWAALEILVNSAFKTRYQHLWNDMLLVGTPPPAHTAALRYVEVTEGKLRLRDKFLIVAAILSGETAEHDSNTFAEIKNLRDRFFHAIQLDEALLPDAKVRELAFRYLALHLSYQPTIADKA